MTPFCLFCSINFVVVIDCSTLFLLKRCFLFCQNDFCKMQTRFHYVLSDKTPCSWWLVFDSVVIVVAAAAVVILSNVGGERNRKIAQIFHFVFFRSDTNRSKGERERNKKNGTYITVTEPLPLAHPAGERRLQMRYAGFPTAAFAAEATVFRTAKPSSSFFRARKHAL